MLKILHEPRKTTPCGDTVSEIVNSDIPQGWKAFFDNNKEILENISEKVGKIKIPEPKHLFEAYHFTPLDSVRVVILSQDPYPSTNNGKCLARGLAFSYPREEPKPSPSMRRIIAEIQRQIPGTTFSNYSLTSWAIQGILLLNSCLTLNRNEKGKNIDEKVWIPFIKNTLREVQSINKNCIFVAWGKHAKDLYQSAGITNYLESCHPSPLNTKPFIHDHFSKINQLLGENPIDWSIR